MTKARDISKLLSTANGKIAGASLDVSFENISDSGTTGTKVASGTTGQRGSTAGQIRFNTTTGLAEYYTGTEFKVIDSPPTVTVVSPLEVESDVGGNITFTITGSNFQSGAVTKFIGNDATEITASTTTVNSSSSISAIIAKSSFVNAKEPYDVKVINTSGLSGILDNQIAVDVSPTWSTASGTLATIIDSATGTHATVSATDIDGDTVSYSETGGTVLTTAGLTLNSSTGAISGNPTDVGSATTYSFNLRASAGGINVDRAFNIIVNPTLDGSASNKAATSALSIYNLSATFQGAGANGVYWLKNSSGTTYQAYCNMSVQTGGWELIWNTAGNGTINSDPTSAFAGFVNKNFWENQTYTVGTTSTPYSSVMYKSSGFQYRNDFTKIMIIAHNAGGACTTAFGATSTNFGDVGGVWTLNNTYLNKSFYELMNNYANQTTIAAFTTQLGALTTSNQTSGIISNTTRNGQKGSSSGQDSRTIGLPLFDNQLDLVTNVYLKGSSPDIGSETFDSNGGIANLNSRTPTIISSTGGAGSSGNRTPDYIMDATTVFQAARLTGRYGQRSLDVRNLSANGSHNGHQTHGGIGTQHSKAGYALHAHADFSHGYHRGEMALGTSENQTYDNGNNNHYGGGSSPSEPVAGRSRVDFAIFVKN